MTLSCLFLYLLVICTTTCMTSAETKLSLNVLHDVNFTCAVEGFEGKMASLLRLQIVKKNEHGRDVVLASMDHDGIRSRLRTLAAIHPLHEVSGNFDFMQKWNSWLKLAVFQFDPIEDGDYACWIHYLDHPADTVQSTMEATLPVNTTREFGTLLESENRQGFTVWLQRSVQAVCEYEADERSDLHLPAAVSFLENDTTALAAWKNDDGRFELESRSSRVSLQPPKMETDRRIVFEARVLDISCAKPWKCTCVCQQEVLKGDTPPTCSSSQELPQPCADDVRYISTLRQPTSLNTSSTPKGIQDTALDKTYVPQRVKDAPPGRKEAPLHHFTLGLFISVAAALLVFALIGLVAYRLKKSKRACFKARRDADDIAGEVKEPLFLHLGSGTATEDVELNKGLNRLSSSSLCSDKLSVNSSAGGLGLKLRSDACLV